MIMKKKEKIITVKHNYKGIVAKQISDISIEESLIKAQEIDNLQKELNQNDKKTKKIKKFIKKCDFDKALELANETDTDNN